MKNISKDNLLVIFIRTLKDNIQHEVSLFEPSSLEKDFVMERKIESDNMAMTNGKAFSNTYRENNVPSPKPPQRFTPQQLDERREKGSCFNCDNKYSKGHKCTEKKLFYTDYEEEERKEEEAYQEEATSKEIEEYTSEEISPTIYFHALAGINTQTFKIEGYIKKKKVIGNKLPFQTMLPELDEEAKIILEPEEITEIQTRQL